MKKLKKLSIEKLEEQATVFAALGDKTRLSLVALLANGEVRVQSLCEALELPQSSVSHHLSLLRVAGVVKTRRDGKNVFYSHADLPKHRLGSKGMFEGINAAKFGPAELTLL